MDEMLFCRNAENGEMTLPLAIGRDENGRPLWLDLAAAPNILLAGCTKQGKSVAMNAMIASLMLLKGQEEVEFIFIDPKMAELAVWAGAAGSRYAGGESESNTELDRLVVEMESRLSGLAEDPRRKYPKIVVFVDEYVDLMDYGSKKTAAFKNIVGLSKAGNAVGIHMVISTNRVSSGVITKEIKETFPVRMGFRMIDKRGSILTLDTPGAELLDGNGDMLLLCRPDVERVQGTFLSTDECMAIKVKEDVKEKNNDYDSVVTPE